MPSQVIKILFVCTGNICRSPTAESVFRSLVEKEKLGNVFHVESAGTDSYHEGQPTDPRAVKTAKKGGVTMEARKARRITEKDYFDFDYIFAMDGGHFYEIQERAPQGRKAKIEMFLRSAAGLKELEVPDPWYGTEADFDNVYRLIEEGSKSLLDRLKEDHRI